MTQDPPIEIQRAARHKDGWKMRFSCNGLIATVTMETERLQQAMIAGERVAKQYFSAMREFNQPAIDHHSAIVQRHLGGS